VSAPRKADVVVLGGGAIGCAVARKAALAGLSVVVVERGTPGGEASSAAAGMLSPLAEAAGPGPFLDLLLHARELYPELVDALREETGADVGYGDRGTLVLSLRERDDDLLDRRWAWQTALGLGVDRIDAEEARRLEPRINPALRFALRFPGDHHVDARALSSALWSAAARAGARFHLGAEAAGVVRERGRAVAVELSSGERIAAGDVVVALGCWAGRLGGLSRPLPVGPVRGQLLAVESVPPLFRHVVDSPRCYLVPRGDGRVIAGATVENAGFRKAVTPAGVRRLIDGAVEIAPSLRDAALVETWSGLRPGTPDGLPILGADPEVASLFYATGHYRNGILLAPLTGELIGALLLGASPSVDLTPYRPDRFS
jgi:glycine oxidase